MKLTLKNTLFFFFPKENSSGLFSASLGMQMGVVRTCSLTDRCSSKPDLEAWYCWVPYHLVSLDALCSWRFFPSVERE